MTNHRISPKAGFAWQSSLQKGPNGRCLCRWCQQEVGKGRRTFCGDDCVHEWKIRTQPGYVRDLVFKRDAGVCATCGLDTDSIAKMIRKACYQSTYTPDRDQAFLVLDTIKAQWPWALYERTRYSGRFPSLWQADHIIPVVEGGGECGLDNYRTLCSPCHKKVTKELAARRAAARKKEKDGQPSE